MSVMEAIIKGLQQLRHRQLTLVQLQLRSADGERKAQLQTAEAVLQKDIRQYEPTKHLMKTWKAEQYDKSRR